jgi:hypothetical protein
VTGFFDAIDAADPIVLLAGLAVLLLVLAAVEWELRRRRWRSARDYLQGYALGYDEGSSGKMRAFAGSGDVPTSFKKPYRR